MPRVRELSSTGEEQYCNNPHAVYTYNGRDQNGEITFGGYSTSVVVDENYVLHISDKLDLAATAPLLCAGITTYSPLRHWNVGKGKKLGVMGLGGLGHMGLKFGHAFGAHVVQFTTSPNKVADARKLGADDVVISTSVEANGASTPEPSISFSTRSRRRTTLPPISVCSSATACSAWSARRTNRCRFPSFR